MNLQLELSKTHAILHNLIAAFRLSEEGKNDVDVLGSLLVLEDQLDKVDDALLEEEH